MARARSPVPTSFRSGPKRISLAVGGLSLALSGFQKGSDAKKSRVVGLHLSHASEECNRESCPGRPYFDRHVLNDNLFANQAPVRAL
jgi:hypothetical protein